MQTDLITVSYHRSMYSLYNVQCFQVIEIKLMYKCENMFLIFSHIVFLKTIVPILVNKAGELYGCTSHGKDICLRALEVVLVLNYLLIDHQHFISILHRLKCK